MNYRMISACLGVVATFMGVCMFLCLPWALPLVEGVNSGAMGLSLGGVISIAVGFLFSFLGKGSQNKRLFRKEAIVVVTSSWIVAILLGTLPYLMGDCFRELGEPITFVDALFESTTGLTTTGSTIFAELDNPELLPRAILFWRGLMQFLGGLGVMCFFVVILGRGSIGKMIMKLERPSVGDMPISKMRELASSLLRIYVGMTIVCAILFLICGMSLFDAVFYSFSVISLGGLHAHTAGWEYFNTGSGVRLLAIESVAVLFMILAASNYWLIYCALKGKPGKLFHDFEWRAFIGILVGAIIITTVIGLNKKDFGSADRPSTANCDALSEGVDRLANGLVLVDESVQSSGYENVDLFMVKDSNSIEGKKTKRSAENTSESFWEKITHSTVLRALGSTCFHTVSFTSGAGFAVQRYDLWNSLALAIFSYLMIVGGCSGSTTGGVKVFRVVLTLKALTAKLRRLHSPDMVRATRMHGANVDPEIVNGAFSYVMSFCVLIAITTFVVMMVEPDTLWEQRNASQVDKWVELEAGTLAMYSNVGSGFGALSCFENYSGLTSVTKIIFCFAALVGRLEIWCVLSLFSPTFWRSR